MFFAIVVITLIVNSPGWSAPGGVRDAFFNKEIFLESLPKILDGFWLNVRIFLTAEILVLIFALVVGSHARVSRGPSSRRSGCWPCRTRSCSEACRRSW